MWGGESLTLNVYEVWKILRKQRSFELEFGEPLEIEKTEMKRQMGPRMKLTFRVLS